MRLKIPSRTIDTMYMRPDNFASNSRHRDARGFSLIEILVVVVVLGILASVAVFAVRGLTDQADENAEATDLRTLETAVEAYYALNQTNPADQATLVADGLLREPSSLHDYSLNADGSFTITTTDGDLAGGVAPAPTWEGTPGSLAGYPTVSFGSGAYQMLIFGGDAFRPIWNTEVTSGETMRIDWTLHVVDATQLEDLDDYEALLAAAQAAGFRDTRRNDADDFVDACASRTMVSCITLARDNAAPGFRIFGLNYTALQNAWIR